MMRVRWLSFFRASQLVSIEVECVGLASAPASLPSDVPCYALSCDTFGLRKFSRTVQKHAGDGLQTPIKSKDQLHFATSRWDSWPQTHAANAIHTNINALLFARISPDQPIVTSHFNTCNFLSKSHGLHTSTKGSCPPVSDKQVTSPWPPTPVHWIESAAPHAWLPYIHLARAHKPIGTWLLAWPCFWSIALATPPGAVPDLYTMMLFGTGAVVRSCMNSSNGVQPQDSTAWQYSQHFFPHFPS